MQAPDNKLMYYKHHALHPGKMESSKHWLMIRVQLL